MPGRISDDAIRTIRERASLIEVVSDVVALRRRGGRSAVGLCPFHAEKTPSFTVNDDRGIFHCFGCGAGGNALDLYLAAPRLPVYEGALELCARLHLPAPRRERPARASRRPP
jgi:DNA primase